MGNDELRELQDPQNWDFDAAEQRAPVKRARAVVSVAFQREEYEKVANIARQFNMRTSEYIREAALGRVRPRPVVSAGIASSGGVVQNDFTGAANATFTLEERAGRMLVTS
jgi:hypothetical protein